MDLRYSLPLLVAFTLTAARMAAFIAVSPPFNTRAISGRVKALLSAALALPVAPNLVDQVRGLSTTQLVGAMVIQVLAGLAMGFVSYLLYAAFEAAGNIMDSSTGFSAATMFDPMSSNVNSPFGRLHQMLMIVLLLVSGAHLVIFNALMRSFELLPLDGVPSLGENGRDIAMAMTTFFLTALQLAAPILAVMFIADVGLALLNRIAPAMNVFTLGFALKIMGGLLVVGFTFPLLPGAIDSVTEKAANAMLSIAAGGGG